MTSASKQRQAGYVGKSKETSASGLKRAWPDQSLRKPAVQTRHSKDASVRDGRLPDRQMNEDHSVPDWGAFDLDHDGEDVSRVAENEGRHTANPWMSVNKDDQDDESELPQSSDEEALSIESPRSRASIESSIDDDESELPQSSDEEAFSLESPQSRNSIESRIDDDESEKPQSSDEEAFYLESPQSRASIESSIDVDNDDCTGDCSDASIADGQGSRSSAATQASGSPLAGLSSLAKSFRDPEERDPEFERIVKYLDARGFTIVKKASPTPFVCELMKGPIGITLESLCRLVARKRRKAGRVEVQLWFIAKRIEGRGQ
jgi:hypothetical protein